MTREDVTMSDGKVLWHFTGSLDGFLAGPDHSRDTLAPPVLLGDGREPPRWPV